MLELLGSLFIGVILAILSIRLAYFRGRINTLQDITGTRRTESSEDFEKAIASDNKFERSSRMILDLVARLNAWKDNDRKLEKAYERNRSNEKCDMIFVLPVALLIVFHYIFEYYKINVDSYNLSLVLFGFCFLGYTIFTALKSYNVINKMEDKLGVGRRKFTQ